MTAEVVEEAAGLSATAVSVNIDITDSITDSIAQQINSVSVYNFDVKSVALS